MTITEDIRAIVERVKNLGPEWHHTASKLEEERETVRPGILSGSRCASSRCRRGRAMLDSARFEAYAEERAKNPTEEPHWLNSDTTGQSEAVYCRSCAEAKAHGDQFVDGGWSSESDSRRWCEECGKELRVSPTDYAANDELAHWHEHGPPQDGADWWGLAWAMRAFAVNDPRWALVRELFAKWEIDPKKETKNDSRVVEVPR